MVRKATFLPDGAGRNQPGGALARWGTFVHQRKGIAFALSGLVLLASIAALANGGNLEAFQVPADTESGRGFELMETAFPARGGAGFLLLFGDDGSGLTVDDDAYRDAMDAALAPLEADPRVKRVITPYEAPQAEAARLVSADRTHAIVEVDLVADMVEARAQYEELRDKVDSDTLMVTAASGVAIFHDFDHILAEDLEKAETAALPLSLLLLLLVFGAVVAALLPLMVGVLAILGGIGGVLLLSQFTDVTIYATNIITLIGLGVAIDYSLFIVQRFREETAKGMPGEAALARTMATAGRAVMFSGLTVAVGLSGLLFYQGLFLTTMGVAGALVVLLAVFYALTFLPALLALLGPRVDKGRIRNRRSGASLSSSGDHWRRLANGVMRRPVAVLVPVVLVLVLVGSPFLQLQVASGGVEQLPPHSESRRGQELMATHFPERATDRLIAVVAWPAGTDPLGPDQVGALYDLSRALAELPHVARVEGIVDLDPALGKADYQALYQQPREAWPPGVAELVDSTVGGQATLLTALPTAQPRTEAARDGVEAARAVAGRSAPEQAGAEVLVTGNTAVDLDTLDIIVDRTPYAVTYIVLVTIVLLLVQTGSVVLPLKAVVMNLLSIAASFGALVWIFQQGNLAGLLGFTPGPLDPSVPVLLFAIVFGLSMDYEVLLLSRIHEEYLRTRDNTRAVAEGLQRSGALITGAAAIMVVVFGAFALTGVVFVKAMGVGLPLAIAVDATLVRALVVPATMRLMGDANWWGPKWLQRWSEHGPAPRAGRPVRSAPR